MIRRLLFVLLCLSGATAQADSLPRDVSLAVGETVLLVADVRRTALGSGRVVSLAVPERGQLLLFGESAGETTAQLWLSDGTVHQLGIRVQEKDPGKRLADVQQLLAGISAVRARISGRFVVLEGSRASAEEQARAAEIAALFPGEVLDFVGRADWETMVQLQVRIVEVRRDQLRKLGLRWDEDTAGPSVSVNAGGPVRGLSIQAMLASELRSRIDLLQQQGLAYTLAEPVLSCRSGGTARFVSGGEIPIPVTDGLGSTDVQYKEYGVILEARPRADRTGAVYAEVHIELSQLDSSVRVGDFPGFVKRQTSTAFNAQEGETIAIAGLVLREHGRDRGGIPGLSALPGAGALFRSTRRMQRETELVVLITPHRFDGGSPVTEPVVDQARLLEREGQLREQEQAR